MTWNAHINNIASKAQKLLAASYTTGRFRDIYAGPPRMEFPRNMQKHCQSLLCYTKLHTIWLPSIQTSISLLRHHSHDIVSLRYKSFGTSTDYFKFSFFPHTVVLWNALPPDIVSASSLDQFKSQIQTHYN
jgi:hypothetical protein